MRLIFSAYLLLCSSMAWAAVDPFESKLIDTLCKVATQNTGLTYNRAGKAAKVNINHSAESAAFSACKADSEPQLNRLNRYQLTTHVCQRHTRQDLQQREACYKVAAVTLGETVCRPPLVGVERTLEQNVICYHRYFLNKSGSGPAANPGRGKIW